MQESEEPQHRPPEWMQENGYANFMTKEDLEALNNETLIGLGSLCEVDTYAPNECIPCLAQVIVAERIQAEEGQSSAGPGEEGIPFEETPEIRNFAAETAPEEVHAPEPISVVEQFATRVKELDALVQILLNGPPIPPPNVSLPELALLTMGADRWVRITEAQGVELSAEQQQLFDATKALVARLRP